MHLNIISKEGSINIQRIEKFRQKQIENSESIKMKCSKWNTRDLKLHSFWIIVIRKKLENLLLVLLVNLQVTKEYGVNLVLMLGY